MKKLLALILSIGLWTTSAEAAVVWFAGAETGGIQEFGAQVLNTCSASTSEVRSGAYALHCPSTFSAIASPTGFALTTAYIRFYVQYAVLSSGTVPVLRARSSSNVLQIQLSRNFTTGFLEYNYAGGAVLATGTIPIVTGTWYLIEAKFVNAAGTGGLEVKIDNVVQFSDFAQTTNGNGAIDHFVFGITNCCSADVYYDDILLSNSAYPGAGRSIARQGLAGAPTYNAWTKNSCSGGTIDNCWSNTPFTAGTPNASSSTPADAQTMLVHSFATTQSGHGTEVLAGGDTINACRVGIVAKAATGSQLYIRQRLGGVDTDTLFNLTAADVYYEGALFIDTFANLNAAEIGAVQNSGP